VQVAAWCQENLPRLLQPRAGGASALEQIERFPSQETFGSQQVLGETLLELL